MSDTGEIRKNCRFYGGRRFFCLRRRGVWRRFDDRAGRLRLGHGSWHCCFLSAKRIAKVQGVLMPDLRQSQGMDRSSFAIASHSGRFCHCHRPPLAPMLPQCDPDADLPDVTVEIFCGFRDVSQKEIRMTQTNWVWFLLLCKTDRVMRQTRSQRPLALKWACTALCLCGSEKNRDDARA